MVSKNPPRKSDTWERGIAVMISQIDTVMRAKEYATKFHGSPVKETQKKTEKIIDKKSKIEAKLLSQLLAYKESKNPNVSSEEKWEIYEYVREEAEKINKNEKIIEKSYQDYIDKNGKK